MEGLVVALLFKIPAYGVSFKVFSRDEIQTGYMLRSVIPA
jgi:hypothetical protein